jgi:toxin HigB-1
MCESIERSALRKLVQLDLAQSLPGNRLEQLSGDRKGQWSVRINDQFRICFRWTDEGPADVEIVDDH